MQLDLKGHIALVTGGASGIGRACAEEFLREGAQVAIWDLAENLSQVAAELEQTYDRAVRGFRLNITDGAAVQSAWEATLESFSHVDHLVHAAAIGSGKFGFPFTNLTPEDWRQVIDVNVMGMAQVAHAVSPHMAERGVGTQVYIASVAGQIGSQTDPPYSASKAANINFAQCLAKDLAGSGVRVNTVCPGMVQTPLNRGVWQAWHDQQPEQSRKSYEQWAGEKIAQVVPLGRWQTPQDIADMVVFLSSGRAGQVTGQTINVDGGFVMHW